MLLEIVLKYLAGILVVVLSLMVAWLIVAKAWQLISRWLSPSLQLESRGEDTPPAPTSPQIVTNQAFAYAGSEHICHDCLFIEVVQPKIVIDKVMVHHSGRGSFESWDFDNPEQRKPKVAKYEEVGFVIRYANRGPTAAMGLRLSDPLPTGFRFIHEAVSRNPKEKWEKSLEQQFTGGGYTCDLLPGEEILFFVKALFNPDAAMGPNTKTQTGTIPFDQSAEPAEPVTTTEPEPTPAPPTAPPDEPEPDISSMRSDTGTQAPAEPDDDELDAAEIRRLTREAMDGGETDERPV